MPPRSASASPMAERRFCPCGYSAKGNDADVVEAFLRHHESGEHGSMTKVNALRSGMAQVDAAVERELDEPR